MMFFNALVILPSSWLTKIIIGIRSGGYIMLPQSHLEFSGNSGRRGAVPGISDRAILRVNRPPCRKGPFPPVAVYASP